MRGLIANPAKQVSLAAQWMDVKYPGWAHKIDVYQLNLLSPTKCVFGLLTGGYMEPSSRIYPSDVGRFDYAKQLSLTGFSLCTFSSPGSFQSHWVKEIEDRVFRPSLLARLRLWWSR